MKTPRFSSFADAKGIRLLLLTLKCCTEKYHLILWYALHMIHQVLVNHVGASNAPHEAGPKC